MSKGIPPKPLPKVRKDYAWGTFEQLLAFYPGDRPGWGGCYCLLTSEEAVEKALNDRYDLIFMDIQMPRMDGYQATKQIRKRGITSPVVALTANAMKGDDKKCIEAGCTDYMGKPINGKELQRVLEKYLYPENEELSEKTESSAP